MGAKTCHGNLKNLVIKLFFYKYTLNLKVFAELFHLHHNSYSTNMVLRARKYTNKNEKSIKQQNKFE